MQHASQPHRNHWKPNDLEPPDGREADTDHLDPIPEPDWPAQRRNTREEPTMTTATTRIDWTQLHASLSQPFDDNDIRYRAGATNRDKTRAQALPYVDPRAYEDRLNKIVPGAWEVTFEPWGEHRIICRLTIHGITRSSTGEATDSPDGIAGTSAEAQAFKRACAKFGLGRHLYALTPRWTEYDASKRAPVKGSRAPERKTDASGQPTRQPPVASGIGRYRAIAMASQLERVDVPKAHQLSFAARTINRYVRDLADLSPEEAKAIWRAATSSSEAIANVSSGVSRHRSRTRP